jgi:hypothetical protein
MPHSRGQKGQQAMTAPLKSKLDADNRTVTFLDQRDIDAGILAVADAQGAVIGLLDAMTPVRHAVDVRLVELATAISAKAPKTTTKGEIEAQAQVRLEMELAEAIRTKDEDARRLLKHAKAVVAKNVKALADIPDFRPLWNAGKSGTEHQLEALRAEMERDRVRADWHGRPLPAILAAFKLAHEDEDWTLAHALHAELQAILASGPNYRGYGEGADALSQGQHHIRETLDAMTAQRAAMVEPSTRTAIEGQREAVSRYESQLHAKALLLAEVRSRGRFPLSLATKRG